MRTDIQALRGLAVSIVVLFHAGIGLSGGYLGVDIFFVISGYLITGLICVRLDRGNFSFADFYWRRAKRLLPAAYATFALTTLAMVYFATSAELASFLQQLIGGVTFAANFVLASQVNYFDTNAALKPLLHIWSLAVEEQYYFLAPLILWITPRRLRIPAVATLLVLSLALCFAVAKTRPNFAFFMLPARSWEISIGAMVALVQFAPSSLLAQRIAGNVAVLVLAALSVWTIDAVHPRTDALIACIATAVAIQMKPAILNRGPIAAVLSRIGDISYSLYLVHWPVFSLAHQVYFGPLPLSLRLACIFASLALAALLYFLIERPIHRSAIEPSWPAIGAVAASVAITIAVSALYLHRERSETDWAEVRKPNHGFGRSCDQYGQKFAIRPECQTKENPRIAVWGDSFGMHIIDGIAQQDHGYGVVQLTRSTCEPTLDPIPDVDCTSFNAGVFKHISASPSIEYVILATAYDPVKLEETIRKLRSANKKVIFVAAPPSIGVDFSLCVERAARGLETFNVPPGCVFKLEDSNKRTPALVKGALELASSEGVTVIWPSDVLCEEGTCRTR
ncbi:peptidoglycan/LPS O-acetylase OafA/YrhL [Bradyrhizobium ottawaense]|uniref:acyltransferase family protein n=1 Tax=Bradyrhizobium ottawaense TaxID=931866 RepID=UPI003832E984